MKEEKTIICEACRGAVSGSQPYCHNCGSGLEEVGDASTKPSSVRHFKVAGMSIPDYVNRVKETLERVAYLMGLGKDRTPDQIDELQKGRLLLQKRMNELSAAMGC